MSKAKTLRSAVLNRDLGNAQVDDRHLAVLHGNAHAVATVIHQARNHSIGIAFVQTIVGFFQLAGPHSIGTRKLAQAGCFSGILSIGNAQALLGQSAAVFSLLLPLFRYTCASSEASLL